MAATVEQKSGIHLCMMRFAFSLHVGYAFIDFFALYADKVARDLSQSPSHLSSKKKGIGKTHTLAVANSI